MRKLVSNAPVLSSLRDRRVYTFRRIRLLTQFGTWGESKVTTHGGGRTAGRSMRLRAACTGRHRVRGQAPLISKARWRTCRAVPGLHSGPHLIWICSRRCEASPNRVSLGERKARGVDCRRRAPARKQTRKKPPQGWLGQMPGRTSPLGSGCARYSRRVPYWDQSRDAAQIQRRQHTSSAEQDKRL